MKMKSSVLGFASLLLAFSHAVPAVATTCVEWQGRVGTTVYHVDLYGCSRTDVANPVAVPRLTIEDSSGSLFQGCGLAGTQETIAEFRNSVGNDVGSLVAHANGQAVFSNGQGGGVPMICVNNAH